MKLFIASLMVAIASCQDKKSSQEVIENVDIINQPCENIDCIKTSKSLLQNMNTSVNPCDNFYEFACGKWVSETRIPEDKGRWSNFDIVDEEIYFQGRELLEAEHSDGDFKSFKLARDYYKSCIDEQARDNSGVRPLLNVLQKAGGWPVLLGNDWPAENSFKWWEWVYSMNNIGLGINGLITFTMGSDDKNSSWRVLGFDQASLGTSREYLIEGFDDQNVQHYYNYMVKSAMLLGASEESAKDELKESLLFEIALAKISKPKNERRNADLLYNPSTLDELPFYDGFPPSWTNFVQTILNETEDTNVTGSDRVIVTSFEYFKDLANLINSTENRVIANHLGWQAVRSAMSSLNLEALKIKETYDKALAGVEKTSPMWKRCVSTVGFGNTAGSYSLGILASSMYIKKFFKPEAKDATLEMTSYLRTTFKEDILEKLDWMDEKTRERAMEKLKSMDQFIGYSDEFLDEEKVNSLHKDISISPGNYFTNTLNIIKFWRKFYYNFLRKEVDNRSWLEHSDVTVVNAFYSTSANYIEFPAAILQGVFFNPNIPKYMNFGAIGFIVGHEITHGFDDKGKQRNAKGEIENWWEPETEKKFKTKAQCIVDQYGNITDEKTNLKLDGFNLQGENIADNGGLKESYQAYLRWVKDHREEPGIVGIPYTPRQLFWISFAQVWCFKYRDESLKHAIRTGTHAPGEHRVLGSISNNVDFSRDFQCPVGSKMNPEEKCSVW